MFLPEPEPNNTVPPVFVAPNNDGDWVAACWFWPKSPPVFDGEPNEPKPVFEPNAVALGDPNRLPLVAFGAAFWLPNKPPEAPAWVCCPPNRDVPVPPPKFPEIKSDDAYRNDENDPIALATISNKIFRYQMTASSSFDQKLEPYFQKD